MHKIGLKLFTTHPHPYHVQWLSDVGEVKVSHMVKVHFKIGKYEDTIVCDVVPMFVCHLLFGLPCNLIVMFIMMGIQTATSLSGPTQM